MADTNEGGQNRYVGQMGESLGAAPVSPNGVDLARTPREV
jgi:hypothetical protein